MTDTEFAADLFAALHAIGWDGVGISRETYGPGEDAAFDLVRHTAEATGLAIETDAAGNMICTLAGTDPTLPAAACGSHVDSVPQGGNFDGAAGVVAGLLALRRLAGTAHRRAVKLLVLRGEESAWFGRPYLGSSAMLGVLSEADLASTHLRSGQTLAERLTARGMQIGPLRRHERLLDPASLACFLELHIEQGPVLVARGLPVAIVTGIRGNIRHRGIVCIGQAGHSGAVPRWLRHDAVFAVAELIGRIDEHWRSMLARGQDLVVTAGIAGTDPAEHALSRIPGKMTFSFEVRSEDTATLEGFYNLLQSDCALIAEERGVRFVFDARIDAAPATMDPALVALLSRQAAALGLPAETMASGAGHDAAIFANAGVPAAMIFVRNAHGSHNPDEAMELADFLHGADLLHAALKEIAT